MKSIKYLAVASALALIAFGASGAAFAGTVLGAASESGTASATARMYNDPPATHSVAPRRIAAGRVMLMIPENTGGGSAGYNASLKSDI